jgi:enterochelin esterase-like enzyme
MFQQKNFKTHLFLFAVLWLLWALVMQPITFVAGRVENHVITSKVLADAGLPDTKELSIYLPEEYDTSGLVYPVLYLLHGSTGTNRSFLGAGYPGFSFDVRVDTIMDKLIASGSIRPFIVALPTYHGDFPSSNPIHYDYIAKEVIPFVDSTYRTHPQREARAISGHSRGGYISNRFAFLYPDRVSLVGSYAGGFTMGLDPINAHPQQRYPLRFWLYSGTNDITVDRRNTTEFAKNL